MTWTKVAGLRIVILWTNAAASRLAETDYLRVKRAFSPTKQTCDIVGCAPPQPSLLA